MGMMGNSLGTFILPQTRRAARRAVGEFRSMMPATPSVERVREHGTADGYRQMSCIGSAVPITGLEHIPHVPRQHSHAVRRPAGR